MQAVRKTIYARILPTMPTVHDSSPDWDSDAIRLYTHSIQSIPIRSGTQCTEYGELAWWKPPLPHSSARSVFSFSCTTLCNNAAPRRSTN